MCTMAQKPSAQQYLVRTQDHTLVIAPIKTPPNMRNCYLLETVETFTFSTGEGKFVPGPATGKLSVKRGENTQKIRGFRAKSHAQLMDKVKSYVLKQLLKVES